MDRESRFACWNREGLRDNRDDDATLVTVMAESLLRRKNRDRERKNHDCRPRIENARQVSLIMKKYDHGAKTRLQKLRL